MISFVNSRVNFGQFCSVASSTNFCSMQSNIYRHSLSHCSQDHWVKGRGGGEVPNLQKILFALANPSSERELNFFKRDIFRLRSTQNVPHPCNGS